MLTSPVFSIILIIRNNPTTTHYFGNVYETVEGGVRQEACDQTIGSTVPKRNEHNRDEGRHGIANVLPIDVYNLAHHQAPDLPCELDMSCSHEG